MPIQSSDHIQETLTQKAFPTASNWISFPSHILITAHIVVYLCAFLNMHLFLWLTAAQCQSTQKDLKLNKGKDHALFALLYI
jgi:hypothetical protein